jgi:hypothetical protein
MAQRRGRRCPDRRRGARARDHVLHVGDGLLARAAFPERVAVGQHHIASGGDARVFLEEVVSIDIAHRHAGQFALDALDAAEQFVFAHVFAQQHLVADSHDVGVPGARHFDHALQLARIDLAVGAEPGADECLQAQLMRDARCVLVAVGA